MNRVVSLFLTWIAAFAGSLPIMFVVGCIGVDVLLSTHQTKVDPQHVDERYPVMVMTRGEPQRPSDDYHAHPVLQRTLKSGDVASIVFYENLPLFTGQYDTWSYFVPPAEVAELNEAIETDPKSQELIFGSVHVTALAPGREEVSLDASIYDDDSNKSVYEATDKQLTPKTHHYHNSLGTGFAAGLAGGYLSIPLSVLSASFLTWRRARKPKSPAAVAVAAGPPA